MDRWWRKLIRQELRLPSEDARAHIFLLGDGVFFALGAEDAID